MKDFFDEEYEKQQEKAQAEQQDLQNKMRDWYASGTPTGGAEQKNASRSPWYIVLICVALVLTFVFGWVMCGLLGGARSQEEKLLSTVMSYLENEYYKEITDAQMQQAVAAAGTAMLQTAGDRFSQLMAPQDFYEYVKQVDNNRDYTDANGYFGISVSHYGVGMYVAEVATDGSCYGILQSGDILLKFTEMKDKFGHNVSVDGLGEFSEMVIADYDTDVVDAVFAATHSANFVYLRGGDVFDSGVIRRGGVGFLPSNEKSKYKFVEYYFDAEHNNISTTNQNNAKHNTFELRALSNLPKDAGYVRISQFMYYVQGQNDEVTAYQEFYEVMKQFRDLGLKRLVLDLKGNPGGRVDVVCNIASMLVTADKLTASQSASVTKGSKLKITSLVPRKAAVEDTYCSSSYYQYFSSPTAKCDIVVWTDGGSASASELLTGALTDYATGFQIGTRTYGKGIAQRIVPLKYTGAVTPIEGDNTTEYYWAIYYTYAAYYSPLGVNIHGTGYAPTEGYDNITEYGNKNSANTLWGATYRYWAGA